MIATNFSNVRNNFKEVCDRVVHDSDIAIITRKNDENVVLMSQAQYDNLMENLHIRESKANYEWVKESIKQAEDARLINFDVEDGQLLGIIGHTGSGKSTLLQHLNGLLKPDEGTIVIGGVDITKPDVSMTEI